MSHIHIFSCEMLLASHLKCSKSCFSSHFIFSIVSGGSNQSSSTYFNAVFESLTHIVCQHHLCDVRLYTWSLVLFVLRSICLCSSLVHIKNGPKYLMRETAQVFISLIRFLQYTFVFSTFLILLRFSFFNFFLHFHLLDGVNF